METRFLRADAGVSCTGISGPLALGEAQSSVQTQLLENAVEHFWTAEETERDLASGDWSVTLRIETAGPSGAAPRVTVRVERRNSSCVVQETLIDEELVLSNSTIQDYTWTASPSPVSFAAGDRVVITVERTNSSNRTATLRFAGESPDDSRMAHPTLPETEGSGEVTAEGSLTGTGQAPSVGTDTFQADAFQNDAFQVLELDEVPLDRAVEVDEAFDITPRTDRLVLLDRAEEVDEAFDVEPRLEIAVALDRAVEVSEAFDIEPHFVGLLDRAEEVDEAFDIRAETVLSGLAWRTPPRLRRELQNV